MPSYIEMFNGAKNVLHKVMEEHHCNIRIHNDTVCYMNSVGTCIKVHNLSEGTLAIIAESTTSHQAYDICQSIICEGNHFKSPYKDQLDAALQSYLETRTFEGAARELYDLISRHCGEINTTSLKREIRESVGVK